MGHAVPLSTAGRPSRGLAAGACAPCNPSGGRELASRRTTRAAAPGVNTSMPARGREHASSAPPNSHASRGRLSAGATPLLGACLRARDRYRKVPAGATPAPWPVAPSDLQHRARVTRRARCACHPSAPGRAPREGKRCERSRQAASPLPRDRQRVPAREVPALAPAGGQLRHGQRTQRRRSEPRTLRYRRPVEFGYPGRREALAGREVSRAECVSAIWWRG